jgi:5-methylcytosine-specific restriction endonuclease McrA
MGPTAGVLDERALVLNRSWMAITTTTIRRAVTLTYQDAARILCPHTYEVHDFDSWRLLGVNGGPVLRGGSFKLQLPEIIVLRAYDGVPKRTVAFSRRNLYRRDMFTCQYCGARPGVAELTIDHVVPRSRGGRTSWENCVLACVDCNKRKSNRTLEDASMTLRSRREAPQWSWEVELSGSTRRPSWEHFLPKHRKRSRETG